MATQKAGRTGRSTEVEFDVRDEGLFFVEASRALSCSVELERMVHRTDGRLLEYFTVEGAATGRVREIAADASGVDRVRLLRATKDGALFEFLVGGPCIGGTLADAGAVLRTVHADEGIGRVTAELPPHVDVRSVVERVTARHDAAVTAQRTLDRAAPEFTSREFRATLDERLTDRQLEVLRAAFAAGYFDWPRTSSAEDCATALDITQPTFTQHLRAGQRKLLETVFEDDIAFEAGARGPSGRDL